MTKGCADCVQTEGYEASLGRHKIYALLPDLGAEAEGDVRILDESGEDCPYPADWHVPIAIPESEQASLLDAS